MVGALLGLTSGVSFGVFTLGITVPFANRKGTISALVVSLGECAMKNVEKLNERREKGERRLNWWECKMDRLGVVER